MRALIFNGTPQLELTRELEIRNPGAGEVLVRIAASGICHSDVAIMDGTIAYPAPAVLGHEGAGFVEALGPDIEDLKIGDAVVIHTLDSCGHCLACENGAPTRCRATLGNLATPFSLRGRPVTNFAATSTFTERTLVKRGQVVKLPPTISPEAACLLGCGVLTGIGAVLHRAKVEPGDSAAVFGIGGVGLNVIQGLTLSGATRIIAVDIVAEKRTLALSFGATDFIDAKSVDAAQQIRKLLPPKDGPTLMGSGGVTWTFDCTGHPAAIKSAIDALDWGGTCVLIGIAKTGATVDLPIRYITSVDRAVIGSRYGSAQPQRDIEMFLDLHRQGRLKLDELVTERYPVERFEDAFADLEHGKLARGVLTF